MRILLDECVNAKVKRAFPGYRVNTVSEAGWRSAKDSALLDLMAGRFDVFVTLDRELTRRFDFHERSFAVILVLVQNNRIESFEPIFDQLRSAVQAARPGQLIHIPTPSKASPQTS